MALVIHGGAGAKYLSQNPEAVLLFDELLRWGYSALVSGATALDVVQAVVKVQEDSGLFNAGKGSIATVD